MANNFKSLPGQIIAIIVFMEHRGFIFSGIDSYTHMYVNTCLIGALTMINTSYNLRSCSPRAGQGLAKVCCWGWGWERRAPGRIITTCLDDWFTCAGKAAPRLAPAVGELPEMFDSLPCSLTWVVAGWNLFLRWGKKHQHICISPGLTTGWK